MTIFKLSLKELQDLFTRGEVSALEIARAFLLRMSQVEFKVKAFITQTDRETLLTQAEAIDKDLAAWRKTMPLMAMPLAIKDNICTDEVRTTCGSVMLEHFAPPYATRNPWNLQCIPGGSSGGSAAAVAADECVAALGSDTGGSIRQPAACCGVVGLKPTYGRVSRYGLVAFASSLDQIGPITKTVQDAAILLNVIAGPDPLDSTSADQPVPDFTKALKKKDVKKLKLGIPKEYFTEGLDPEVEQAIRTAIEEFKNLGGEVRDVSLPSTEWAIATYYVIATAEASSNLARYDGVKYGFRSKENHNLLEMYQRTRAEGFGSEVKRRIMLGTYVLSAGYYDAYYGKAQAVRTLIRREFESVFGEVDLLVTPTMPTPAFQLGEKLQDPLQMYLSDIYTISASLAGIPAISLPCGYSHLGLPIGLQIMGRPFEEDKVLRAAHAYEQATDWRKKRPAIR
jgi:aspartyl-tRNA(Asn)/glutamyl-tRNA(Gln) amidotransferase subunit A